jgi:hypothetical protein
VAAVELRAQLGEGVQRRGVMDCGSTGGEVALYL